jgi:hypothetical protein
MSRIAIIGAGLSGRLLALNLLRFASSDAAVSVWMIAENSGLNRHRRSFEDSQGNVDCGFKRHHESAATGD